MLKDINSFKMLRFYLFFNFRKEYLVERVWSLVPSCPRGRTNEDKWRPTFWFGDRGFSPAPLIQFEAMDQVRTKLAQKHAFVKFLNGFICNQFWLITNKAKCSTWLDRISKTIKLIQFLESEGNHPTTIVLTALKVNHSSISNQK